jgi:hypothetical protein
MSYFGISAKLAPPVTGIQEPGVRIQEDPLVPFPRILNPESRILLFWSSYITRIGETSKRQIIDPLTHWVIDSLKAV